MLSRAITDPEGTRKLFIEKDIFNNDKLESILIPPLNITQTIAYLQNSYGIYDSGVNIFFSPTATYLTSNNYKTIPFQNTIEVNIIPRDESNQEELTKKV